MLNFWGVQPGGGEVSQKLAQDLQKDLKLDGKKIVSFRWKGNGEIWMVFSVIQWFIIHSLGVIQSISAPGCCRASATSIARADEGRSSANLRWIHPAPVVEGATSVDG